VPFLKENHQDILRSNEWKKGVSEGGFLGSFQGALEMFGFLFFL